MKFRGVALISLPFVLYFSGASAGPFGYDFDTFTPSAYGCGGQRGTFYRCDNAPKPHPDMEYYIVQYAEGVGLCMIKGVSNNIRDTVYGDETRNKTDEIHNQLKIKYGSGKKLDFLRSGSIWDEPRDWMMGLTKEERAYAYLWDLPNPIDGVSEIGLMARAARSDQGYIAVEFHSANTDACDEAESNDAASSF